MFKNKKIITKLHFSVLGFIFLNLLINSLTTVGLNYKIIFPLKVILYISGIFLFLTNVKPFKKIAIYLSFYFISPIIVILFSLFGGVFLAILSSILLYPMYPREIKYEKNNLIVYSKFHGFLGYCCNYGVAENQFLFFEKDYGEIKIEDTELNHFEFEIKNDSLIIKN